MLLDTMIDIEIPLSVVVGTGCLTVVLATALAYAMLNSSSSKSSEKKHLAETEAVPAKEKIDLSKFPGGEITVYFATQTGTSESFARELEREGSDHGFFVHVIDLEDADLAHLVLAKRTIFLTATYGEGEAPDNATTFVELLKEKSGIEILFEQQKSEADPELVDTTVLKGVDYCVFGLGNRQYDHFNAMGKFFDKALELAGANRIMPLAVGDDDDDLDMDFENWKDNTLWPTLKEKYSVRKVQGNGHGSSQESAKNKLPECPYQVEYHTNGKSVPAPAFDLPMDRIHSSSRHYFTAFDCPVTCVKELRTKEDPGSTVHVEIDISKAKSLGNAKEKLTYTTADNLAVLPVNESSIVEQVADCLGYDLDAVFSVKAAPNHEWHGVPFPMPCSVRECLTRYCDLTSAPRRSDLKLLASYCDTNSTDQKALLRMASKEGRLEYKEKILEGYVGLVDLLKLCPSIAMPLEHFLNLCSPLHARLFTISSSNRVHPKSIHLTVAVTKHERKDGSLFKGVCSNHLASYKGSKRASIRVFNRPSTFRLPKDSSHPIIMIGPGTGLAPMRAFLQERQYQKMKLKEKIGPNILYFGCKKASQDYIYDKELKDFQKNGVLNHLRVAFSREKAEKVYVQHLLKENADETWKFITEDAHIYVCGGVKMGQDVSEALKEIISSQGGMSMDAAKDYLANLSNEGRFIQELWT